MCKCGMCGSVCGVWCVDVVRSELLMSVANGLPLAPGTPGERGLGGEGARYGLNHPAASMLHSEVGTKALQFSLHIK